VGGAAEFDGTLVSVLQQRPADCEVVVAHTEPYEDPYDLAGEVQFLHCPELSAAVELINTGLAAASGEIVHVLGCGSEATENWADAAVAHFDDPQVASVSPIVLAADDGSIASAGVRYTLGRRKVVADRRLLQPGTARLRASILGPTLAAGFYRRDVLTALEGFDPRVGDSFADVDLALSIHALGRLNVCEPASRLMQGSSDSTNQAGSFERGRQAQRLFRRHQNGSLTLALQPLCITAELVGQGMGAAGLATLAGRAAGALEFGAARLQQARIARAKQRLEELSELRATLRLPANRERGSGTLRRAA
jgi:hypothetical protein